LLGLEIGLTVGLTVIEVGAMLGFAFPLLFVGLVEGILVGLRVGIVVGILLGLIVGVPADDIGSTTTRLDVKLAQYRFCPVSETKVSCTCIPRACTTANLPVALLAYRTPASATD